uniref:Annexin-B9 n=1 Tax=Lygus hesperus TaxID=30085 RepID=A0A0A9VZC1_LYGHE
MAYHPTESKPTVYPAHNFDAKKDAENIHGAKKGQDYIDILCHRSNIQRLEIAKAYKTFYGEDMIGRLKNKTSGNFEKLLVALSTPLPSFYAKELHDAMAGAGTTESTLIEILATLSNFGIKAVKQSYKDLYGKSLEHDITNDTSGHFRKLLVSLAQGNRDENTHVTTDAAEEDARQLLEAGVERWGTDESVFNSILVSRSYKHLEQVFLHYASLAEHTVEEAIHKEFSGDIKDGLLAIVKCVRNKSDYFAERLHKSMKGLGTDDKTLIRIVVARSEIDLGSIRSAFKARFDDTLGNWIHDDTSGDYRDGLLTIAGRA